MPQKPTSKKTRIKTKYLVYDFIYFISQKPTSKKTRIKTYSYEKTSLLKLKMH